MLISVLKICLTGRNQIRRGMIAWSNSVMREQWHFFLSFFNAKAKSKHPFFCLWAGVIYEGIAPGGRNNLAKRGSIDYKIFQAAPSVLQRQHPKHNLTQKICSTTIGSWGTTEHPQMVDTDTTWHHWYSFILDTVTLCQLQLNVHNQIFFFRNPTCKSKMS